MTTPLQDQLRLRGIDVVSLVNEGLDEVRVQQLLNGADPTISEVRKISKKFSIPIRSIITEVKSREGQFKLRENFRSKSNSNFEVLDLLDRADALSNIFEAQSEKRSSINLPSEFKTFEAAEEAASFFREKILRVDDLAPLIDLDERLCSSTDVRTLVVDLRALEGSIVFQLERPFVFLSKRPDPRMRFTLAHEICHYLFDVSGSASSAWFDEDTMNPVGSFRRDEMFANSFASGLLLPPAGVGMALNTFRRVNNLIDRDVSDVEIIFLARLFGVSFQVAARRLEDLKIIPSGGGQSIYEALKKKFSSPEKFADEIGLPQRQIYNWSKVNERVSRDCYSAVSAGRLSVGRLAEIVELPIEKVIRLVSQ